MKVVIDTNVIVSGLINVEGAPAQIVNLLLNGRITLLYDSRVLQEYVEVLYRKKFGFKRNDIEPILDYIRNEGEYVPAEPTNTKFADRDDQMFYEVAKTANAKCMITGNKNHFPNEELIKNPKEFIDLYLSEYEGGRPETT
jgi:putative PIN family toxin of toxin-antitoxin system